MNFLKRVPYINMLYINVYNVIINTYKNLDVLIHGSLYLKSSKKNSGLQITYKPERYC